MSEYEEDLRTALALMLKALLLLDRCGLVPEAAPHLDLAIERIRSYHPSLEQVAPAS